MATIMKILTLSSTFCLVLFCIGVYDFVTNFEENKCQMTYMYQLPQYIKVSLSEKISKTFSHYNLYIYGEGEYADKIRNMDLKGIPVLFIPGNAGSYKQVRSAASIALRKAEFSGTKYHFNYFTVDLNEELSGLFGGVLKSQTEFVAHCIRHILHLYKSKVDSVLIIGHSMGGLIARALFTLPHFDPRYVHTIVTLATPHLAPVISFDRSIHDFYKIVNNYWIQEIDKKLSHVTLTSVGGGFYDILVRQELTSLSELINSKRIISSSSLAVPRVWLSTDHLCIVWCKQLVLVNQRAFFDIINVATNQVNFDPSYRAQVLQKYFAEPNQNDLKRLLEKEPLTLYHHGETILKKDLQWNFFMDKVMKPIYLFIPFLDAEVIFVRVSMQLKEGIFACHDEVCQDRVEITSQMMIIPSTAESERIIQINVKDFKSSFEQIAIYIPRSMNKVSTIADHYNTTDRQMTFFVPYMTSVSSKVFFNSIIHQYVFYKIKLEGLEYVWQVFTISIFSDRHEKCFDETVPPVVKLFTPWSKQEVYYVMNHKFNNSFSIKLQVPKPYGFSGVAELHFIFNPCCQYRAEIKPDIKQALGQIIRFYSAWLPALVIANILLPLGKQLIKISKSETPKSFTIELTHYSYQDFLVISTTIFIGNSLRFIEHLPIFNSQVPSWKFTVFHFPILFFFSFVARLLTQIIVGMILFLISIYAIILTRIRKRFTIYFVSTSMGNFHWKPVLVIGILSSVLLGYGVCGVAVSILAFIIFVCKVCYLQSNLRIGLHTPQNRDEERFLLHFTLLLLWLFKLMIELPTFLVWIKRYPFLQKLEEDPSLNSTLMILFSLPVLFQEHVWKEFPGLDKDYNKNSRNVGKNLITYSHKINTSFKKENED